MILIILLDGLCLVCKKLGTEVSHYLLFKCHSLEIIATLVLLLMSRDISYILLYKYDYEYFKSFISLLAKLNLPFPDQSSRMSHRNSIFFLIFSRRSNHSVMILSSGFSSKIVVFIVTYHCLITDFSYFNPKIMDNR